MTDTHQLWRSGNALTRAVASTDRLRQAPERSEGTAAATGHRSAWRGSLIVLAVASAALGWLFRAEIAAAVQVWSTSATFGHAFFIAPISLLLFYRARHRLARLQSSPEPWAMLPIAFLAVAWMIGEMANVLVVKQLAVVALWHALFLLVLGWRVTRAALFPLLFLYLAVPLGSSAIPVLQDITAQIVVHLLRLTGIPVYLDGFYIQIPKGSFLVAEACSGVRYLIVSFTLGLLAANLLFRAWPRRVFFVALSVIIPIVANGLRAYSIVMLAHLTDHETAAEFDHVLYGFFFLGFVTVILLGVAVLLGDRSEPGVSAAANAGAHPRQQSKPAAKRDRTAQVAYSGCAVALIILAQIWTAAAKEPPITAAPALQLPPATAPWQAADDLSDWQPNFHGHDLALQGAYRLDSEQVDLRVAYYSHQREGAEAISDMTGLLGPARQWRVMQANPATLSIKGNDHPYLHMLLSRPGERYLVWYWYRIGGQDTNSRLFGKVLELAALFGGDPAAYVIAVGSRVSADTRRTEALLESFLTHHITSDGMLVRVGERPTDAAATASP